LVAAEKTQYGKKRGSPQTSLSSAVQNADLPTSSRPASDTSGITLLFNGYYAKTACAASAMENLMKATI
jgi:hypothetical protein